MSRLYSMVETGVKLWWNENLWYRKI